MNQAARVVIFSSALLATPALAQTPPPGGRLFGTDEAPPPGMPPSAPRIVMRLDYIRAPGTEGCPDAQAFRDIAGTKVRGWDPFAPNAPNRLTIAVVREVRGYEGTGELRDVTGAVVWRRPFPPTPRCVDLLEDLAVSLALHVDPPRPPPPPAVPPIALPPPAVEPDPPPSLPLPAQTLARFRFGLSAWGDLAVAPRPAFGLTGYIGFRIAWFSLAGEVRWDPYASGDVMYAARVDITRILGGLVPCGHFGEGRVTFVGCLVGEVGEIRGGIAIAGSTRPLPVREPYAAVGVRSGVEVALVPHLSLSAAVDFLGVIKPFHVDLDVRNAEPLGVLWESPAFTGGLGVGLVATF